MLVVEPAVVYSFIQPTLTEVVLCAKLCAGHCGHMGAALKIPWGVDTGHTVH